MRFDDLIDNCLILLLLRLIYHIVMIDTRNRTVRRNLDDIHAVNIAELLLLGQRRTCHTRFLLELIEEILECDRRKCLALALYLYMLLRFDCLMQSVRVTASRHDTSGELINDHDLVVLYNIVLIAEHQIVGAQRQDNIVLNLKILRIRKIINLKELLDPLYTFLREADHFILLVDDKVSRLLLLNSHDGVHLGILRHILTALHLACQNIARFIKPCGLAALTGNDERCSRLVDQYGVHLVDDSIVKSALYELLLINDHVISQIIEAELVVRHISNIAAISLAALVVRHGI